MLLAGQPDRSILEQLAGAGGSPFLVAETLLGLREEERTRVVDGLIGFADSGRKVRRLGDHAEPQAGSTLARWPTMLALAAPDVRP
jgi:hypothetical protein